MNKRTGKAEAGIFRSGDKRLKASCLGAHFQIARVEKYCKGRLVSAPFDIIEMQNVKAET